MSVRIEGHRFSLQNSSESLTATKLGALENTALMAELQAMKSVFEKYEPHSAKQSGPDCLRILVDMGVALVGRRLTIEAADVIATVQATRQMRAGIGCIISTKFVICPIWVWSESADLRVRRS